MQVGTGGRGRRSAGVSHPAGRLPRPLRRPRIGNRDPRHRPPKGRVPLALAPREFGDKFVQQVARISDRGAEFYKDRAIRLQAAILRQRRDAQPDALPCLRGGQKSGRLGSGAHRPIILGKR